MMMMMKRLDVLEGHKMCKSCLYSSNWKFSLSGKSSGQGPRMSKSFAIISMNEPSLSRTVILKWFNINNPQISWVIIYPAVSRWKTLQTKAHSIPWLLFTNCYRREPCCSLEFPVKEWKIIHIFINNESWRTTEKKNTVKTEVWTVIVWKIMYIGTSVTRLPLGQNQSGLVSKVVFSEVHFYADVHYWDKSRWSC
jgi:hypothetical protein